MRDDIALLLDMLITVRRTWRFASDLDVAGFRPNERHQTAIVRELQIMMKRQNLVFEDFIVAYCEIDQRLISGMRNQLIHEYFRTSLEIMGQTILCSIPALFHKTQPNGVFAIHIEA